MTSTDIRLDILTPYSNAIAIGGISIASGVPSDGQGLFYNSTLNQWTYQPAYGSNLMDTSTVQTVGGIKTFTSVINANGGLHLPSSQNVAINVPNGGPDIDILQNALDVPLGLTYGLRIRKPNNSAFSQFAWDANGFSLYRVDAGVPTEIFTVANGRLTMLTDPSNPQDAATENYVLNVAQPKKLYSGYIPKLFSNPNTTDSIKTGFVATASSVYSNQYIASNPFSYNYQITPGVFGDWATNGVTINFWLQIQCPNQVRIWKVALTGRTQTGTQRIYNWWIQGSTDNFVTATTLYTAANVYLDSTPQQFLIPTTATQYFQFYRIYAFNGEAPNPGLSYFQLFVYSQ